MTRIIVVGKHPPALRFVLLCREIVEVLKKAGVEPEDQVIAVLSPDYRDANGSVCQPEGFYLIVRDSDRERGEILSEHFRDHLCVDVELEIVTAFFPKPK